MHAWYLNLCCFTVINQIILKISIRRDRTYIKDDEVISNQKAIKYEVFDIQSSAVVITDLSCLTYSHIYSIFNFIQNLLIF